ncbi:MAG TPA: S-layer homology domain-containing protein [Candidatus Omnitrophota bacterium]|nr:S-layer homology domain-containing protein [Candidatus Omnitrophota bacterium]
MRRSILLIAFLSICSLASAEEPKFKDMPDRHWAQAAVYDLVKKGVTSGYPDGTFRGFKVMNRQEMASFLSKLAQSSTNLNEVEKLTEELKSELNLAKYEMDNPDSVKLSGSVEERTRLTNEILDTGGPHGPRLDYRIKLNAERDFSSTRYLKIDLDTMDSGFGGGDRDFASKLLDIEGKMRIGNVDLKAAAGPGTVCHVETDGTVPSDDYYIYIRPKTSAAVSTSFGPMDVSAAYVTRKVSPWGEVGVNELTSTASYVYQKLPLFGRTRIALTPRYLWQGEQKDSRLELKLSAMPHPALTGELLIGEGKSGTNRGLYARGSLDYSDPQTEITLIAHKVGGEYRADIDKYEFIPLNYFGKLILDGSVDAGIMVSRLVWNGIRIKFVSDAVLTSGLKYGEEYPGTSITNEFTVGNDNLNLFYRSYFVPSGISSTDPTMSRNIAPATDLIGLDLGLKF